jgi:hypothetical protein
MPYHIGNAWFGGGVPFIGTAIAQTTGIPLGALFYAMVGIGNRCRRQLEHHPRADA